MVDGQIKYAEKAYKYIYYWDFGMLHLRLCPNSRAHASCGNRAWLWDEFSVADVDFDGIPEMLVHFPTYHNEYSSVYIYKQENGKVFSYTDTVAALMK